uniref:COMM domain-containing protein 5 n=1 Tax=Tetranychus urticae TaxID=32264 RepID=T1K2R7_TETUR
MYSLYMSNVRLSKFIHLINKSFVLFKSCFTMNSHSISFSILLYSFFNISILSTVIDYLSENLPVLSESNLQNTESKLLVQNLVILVRNCMRYGTTNRQISLTGILTEELRIASKLSQIIQNEIDSAKMTATIPYGPKLPTCTSIKWRIDVVISSSSLSKVLEPLIIFEIHTDSGTFLKRRFIIHLSSDPNLMQDKEYNTRTDITHKGSSSGVSAISGRDYVHSIEHKKLAIGFVGFR